MAYCQHQTTSNLKKDKNGQYHPYHSVNLSDFYLFHLDISYATLISFIIKAMIHMVRHFYLRYDPYPVYRTNRVKGMTSN